MDETVSYDVPESFGYILNRTQTKKIIFIGHSQGATQFLAHGCENGELGRNVKAFIGLAPLFSIGNHVFNKFILFVFKLFWLGKLCFAYFKQILLIRNFEIHAKNCPF